MRDQSSTERYGRAVRTRRFLSVSAFLLLPVMAVTACGSSGGGGGSTLSPSTAAQPDGSNRAGATAAIKTLYAQFFSAPEAKAVTLLQDGASLRKAIAVAAKIKGKNTESAKVQKVTFPTPTTATVTYALSSNGTVVIPSGTGQAVYENGKWLFAKQTFCTLVSLGNGGKNPPGC